jgi:hypothetical protein
MFFLAYKRGIELAPYQGSSEYGRVVARKPDIDIRKFLAKDARYFGQQTYFGPRHEAKSKGRLRKLSRAQGRFCCRIYLKQRLARMIQKRFASRGELNALSATGHQLRADFLLKIADLTAERWLGCVERLLGGNRQAACIGHGDEVTQMS